ncbi:hypothetical protein Y032_0025g1245 [Ancylostoma ceylanicum]|nr:hypothetical protein Y032_0025g1245 [Ancylostoma ceylanicum]
MKCQSWPLLVCQSPEGFESSVGNRYECNPEHRLDGCSKINESMNMLRKFSPILHTLRQLLCRSSFLRRQLWHHGRRYHHNHHQKNGRWWWDRRVLLALTSAAGFSFAEHGIPDERIEKARHLDKEFDNGKEDGNGWETLVEEDDLKVYRRLVPGPFEMYEYKCVGTYYDITPSSFLDVQNDLKYRKEWDPNVMSLDLLKEEGEHELIRWVQKYPYPLYPREYVYTRRTWVSDDSRMIVVDSEVVPPHLIAGSDKNVRVSTYTSRMAVRSHREFDERGLDFILTYFDNPEANIPRSVYNWIINRGGPYFLNQVHEAACEMEETGRRLTWTSERVQRNRQRLKKLSDAKSAIVLLPESAADEENKVNEEELEDAVPMLTKAQKFSFVSVDNLPAEAYVTV